MKPGPNSPPKPRQQPSTFRPVAHLLLTVLTFAAVGPMVGTVAISIVIAPMIEAPDWFTLSPTDFIVALSNGVAYVVGGVPAAIAGGLIGTKEVWFGGAGWGFALGVGVLVGACLEYFMHGSLIRPGEGASVGLFAATATLSTLVCWRIAQAWSFPFKANP